MKKFLNPEILLVIKITFWWRIGLFLLGLISTSLIGFLFPYPNFQRLIELGNGIPSIWSWGGFDGIHYLTIAESGYVANFTQAFFPLFPWIIGLVAKYLSLNFLYSALLVGNLSLLFAVCLFWRLLRIDFKSDQSRQIILCLLLFPTAFFFGAVYGEAFFLCLVFGSFLAARRKKWVLAGILGAMAAATRLVGIFLLPSLAIEYWLQLKESADFVKPSKSSMIIPILSILMVSLGLIFYLVYLNKHFNDPLKFIHSQPAFGASRSDKIILFYQVFWRYLKMSVTVNFFSVLYYRVMLELFSAVSFLILGLLSLKKTRLSYAVFGFLSFFAPTLTGTFSSMPRYILVMFPVFIMIGSWLDGDDHNGLMKILITGGAGFIASHVADAYIANGHEVAVLDNLSTGVKENISPKAKFYQGDVSDLGFIDRVVSEFKPEVLNHHAAHIHVGRSVDDPKFDATINILGTINIMQSLLRYKSLKKVIFASTGGAMYGNKKTPFSEEMMPAPLSPYGVSKRAAELYLGFYYAQYEVSFVALRYANVYGPRQNPHGEAGVVSIFSKRILEKKQPVINGDGLQTRDYVFVEDVAAANVLALKTTETGSFNIGTSVETDVNSIFELVNKNFGADWDQVHGPVRAGEQMTSSLSYQKARKILNWEPKIKLAEGIKKTVEWFKSHPERV